MANIENNKQSNSNDDDLKKSFNSYIVGDKDSLGRVIKRIYGASPWSIIYSTGYGNVAYSHRGLPEHLKCAIAEFSHLDALGRAKLRGAYRKDLADMLGFALASAMESTKDEKPLECFSLVREFIEEKGPIDKVYGYGPDYIIFETKKKQISVEYQQLNETQTAAIAEFNRLINVAECSLPKAYRKTACQMLGDELATAFRAGEADVKDIKSAFFQSSREYIETRSQSFVRSRYTIYSLISALVILTILLLVYLYIGPMNKLVIELIVGCAGGVIGALISVMQRGQSLAHERFVPIFYMVFQGFFRILLGVIFGFLIVVGVKANLALGIVGDNMYSLVLLSVAAGFSERFIPDLLTRIGEENLQEAGASPEATQNAGEG
jgi:hypothetical protein